MECAYEVSAIAIWDLRGRTAVRGTVPKIVRVMDIAMIKNSACVK
jgi:hypothetical protein